MKPTLILIDIWPLPSAWMDHLDDYLEARHNIARLVNLFVDHNLPVCLYNSGICLPSDPPELVQALTRSGNLLSSEALAGDGYETLHRLSGDPWPVHNPSSPTTHGPLLYAGFCADYSLGTHPRWGYLHTSRHAHRDIALIEGATLVLPDPSTIPSGHWKDWQEDPMAGAPLRTRTRSFLHDHARESVTDILAVDDEVEEVENWLGDQLEAIYSPAHAPFTLVCVPFPVQEGEHPNTIRLINSVESWVSLDPQPEILFLCEDERTARFLSGHYPGVRTVIGLERNKIGDLDLGHIFRIADDLATHDLICYCDSDLILLPGFVHAMTYISTLYQPGTYSVCANRWESKVEGPVDYDDPVWPEVVRSQITKLCKAGSDFSLYPRGLLHDMPPFSIGKGHWDGWRMGRIRQLGLHLVNIQELQLAIHQRHGHRFSGHPGTRYNLDLIKASGTDVSWVRDTVDNIKREDFDTWLNRPTL
jgi:hypothetical protein